MNEECISHFDASQIHTNSKTQTKKLVWNLENGKIAIAIYQLLFNIRSFQN